MSVGSGNPCTINLAYDYYVLVCFKCVTFREARGEERQQRWEGKEVKQEQEDDVAGKMEIARKVGRETREILDIDMRTLGLSEKGYSPEKQTPGFEGRSQKAQRSEADPESIRRGNPRK